MARIICDNGDRTEFVQPSTMILSDAFLNAYQYCSNKIIPSIDLSQWKDNVRITYMPTKQEKFTIANEITRAKREAEIFRQIEKEAFSMSESVCPKR